LETQLLKEDFLVGLGLGVAAQGQGASIGGWEARALPKPLFANPQQFLPLANVPLNPHVLRHFERRDDAPSNRGSLTSS